MIKNFEKIVKKIETTKIEPVLFFVLFYLLILSRNLLESFLEIPHKLMNINYLFLDYFFWYSALFLSIVLFLHVVSKEKIEKITKAVFVSFFVILFVPVIDFVLTRGKGFLLKFILGDINHLIENFLLFGKFWSETNASPGQFVAVLFGMLTVFLYIKIKTNNKFKAIISAFLFYLIVYFYSALPSILNLFLKVDVDWNNGNTLINLLQNTFYLTIIVSVIQLFNFYYFFEKKKLKQIVCELFPTRSLHYVGMLVFGFVIAFSVKQTNFNILNLGMGILSVFLAFQSSLKINNFFDLNLEKKEKQTGYFLIIISSFIALKINFEFFILILIANLFGVIYSKPPIRIKKIGFLNNLWIAIISLIVVIAGFLINQPIIFFPLNKAVLIFIIFSLASNIKDLKDIEQDKKNSIKTIPVIFKFETAKKIIGTLVGVSFIITPFVVSNTPIELLFLGFLFGITNFLMILKTGKELPVFLSYFMFLGIIMLFLT